MDKRSFLAGLTALPFLAIVANAATTKKAGQTVTWTVPKGVYRIRVRSWGADGSKNIDRKINVEPGERFQIDTLED